jgi:hypothetical protein
VGLEAGGGAGAGAGAAGIGARAGELASPLGPRSWACPSARLYMCQAVRALDMQYRQCFSFQKVFLACF